MSEFLFTSGHLPQARLDGLASYLQMPGSVLTGSQFPLGSGRLVALSTGTAPGSATAWAKDFHRCTGASLSLVGNDVEIETPFVTGRTLWRFHDGERDLWSTSLRALSFLVGDVVLDEGAARSMLVSGTLGPEMSWDRRIRQAPPASRFVLGAPGSSGRAPAPVGPLSTRRDWELELERRLRDVVAALDLDAGEWGLPLSGGVDSRGLAIALAGALPSFTWGAGDSRADPLSDLSVALRLAEAFGLDHRSLELTSGDVESDDVLDRFAAASECRTENIGGYVDGMQLWQDLRVAGVTGIVRGDEVFGWNRRNDSPATRVSTGAVLPGDLVVPSELRNSFATIGTQFEVLSWIGQSSGESLPDYRDRLYRRFRCPSILSALTQTKSGYVDVTNPYLADPIVELVMAMPAKLRTDKRLFKRFVTARSKGIPFAERSSVPPSSDFLGSESTSRILCERLSSSPSPVGVPSDVLEFVTSLGAPGAPGSARFGRRRAVVAAVRRTVPHSVRREYAIRQASQPQRLDRTQLRFRTYLVAEGQNLMAAAAAAGNAVGPSAAT